MGAEFSMRIDGRTNAQIDRQTDRHENADIVVLYIFQNKQWFFLYTPLTDLFLKLRGNVFTARYELIFLNMVYFNLIL